MSCTRFEVAIQESVRSTEARRGRDLVNAVDSERALEMAKIALAHKETALAGHDMRAQAYLVLGNVAAAEAEQSEAAKLLPDHFIAKSIAAQVAAARGDRAAAERHIATLAEDAKTVHWAALRVALCYAKLGDQARAVEYIDRAIALGNKNWYFMVKQPWLQPVQQLLAFQTSVTSIRRELDDVRDDVMGVHELICKAKPTT